MVDIVNQRDPAAYSLGSNAAPAASIVAGGSGNGVAVTGITIDRTTIGMAQVAIFATLFEANLTANKTLSLSGLKVEHSTDGATWVPYVPPYPNTTYTQPGVVATGPTGNGIVRGTSAIEVSLSSAYRYVRFDMTPTLSNTATDTAVLMTHAHFGGFSHVPPP
jgi:hypothetical protein